MKRLLSISALLLCFATGLNAQNFKNEYIKVGQKAPDLEYPNPEGKKIKLSEVNKGRYIILDFWASWCGPCRMSNPGLVRIYNKYSKMKFKNAKKGFTVVSVSLDMRKDNWVNAIQHDGLVWPNHMSDLNPTQWQSAVCPIYGIEYIPQAFLIGPDGTVLAKYNRAEDADADIQRYAN